MFFWIWPVIIFLIIIIFAGLKIMYEYERAVVFTLGRYRATKGPGLIYIIPIFQTMKKVDLRIMTADIPRQEVMTKDNIPILANTVVYYRVENPEIAITKIQDYGYAVRQFTQAALRDVVGNEELDFVLTEREKIATSIKKIVDSETGGWGINIEAIKIQEMEMPAEMKRAMAKQAEAEREKRANIISAEGELKASENLAKAAENLSKSPAAIQLRMMQTIRDIAADPSEKIVLFLPSDVGQAIGQVFGKKK